MVRQVVRALAAIVLAWFGLASMFENTYRAERASALTVLRSETVWALIGLVAAATAIGLLLERTRQVASWMLAAFTAGMVVLLVGFTNGEDPYVIFLAFPLALFALASALEIAAVARDRPENQAAHRGPA